MVSSGWSALGESALGESALGGQLWVVSSLSTVSFPFIPGLLPLEMALLIIHSRSSLLS